MNINGSGSFDLYLEEVRAELKVRLGGGVPKRLLVQLISQSLTRSQLQEEWWRQTPAKQVARVCLVSHINRSINKR